MVIPEGLSIRMVNAILEGCIDAVEQCGESVGADPETKYALQAIQPIDVSKSTDFVGYFQADKDDRIFKASVNSETRYINVTVLKPTHTMGFNIISKEEED